VIEQSKPTFGKHNKESFFYEELGMSVTSFLNFLYICMPRLPLFALKILAADSLDYL
jgi:hypothetical protein